MPKDEIECDRCHQVLHYLEFSKNQRKEDDPCCLRCVAWGETQHHGVVPAPLATGHVSTEETTGEVWIGRAFLTDEDYCRPQAPVSGRSALGLEGGGIVTDEALQRMTEQTTGLGLSDTQSVTSDSTTRGTASVSNLPPHLARRPGASSAAGSDLASNSNASVSGASNAGLPPHLRRKAPSGAASSASVSTATTVREAKEQEKQARATNFNAWDAQGVLTVKKHVPSTLASSEGSVGGSSQASGARQGPSSFVKPKEMSRPARQIDVNPVPPPGLEMNGRRNNFPKARKDGEPPVPEEWPATHW